MSGKTKIVVLHTKEIIYTALFAILGIVLIVLLIYMFRPKNSSGETNSAYIPGVYQSSMELGENTVDIEVVVDADRIHSINMYHTSESVATMYPLMEPALETLAVQIYEKQSLDDITYSEENRYTSMLLLDTIEKALEKAKVPEAEDSSSDSGTIPEIIY